MFYKNKNSDHRDHRPIGDGNPAVPPPVSAVKMKVRKWIKNPRRPFSAVREYVQKNMHIVRNGQYAPSWREYEHKERNK